MRSHLGNIQNPTTRAFVEEAIKCHEYKLHRSAVVMSWMAALNILHRHVCDNCLDAFNEKAKENHEGWRDAKNIDGMSRMKEADFLKILVDIGVVGGDVKRELEGCLKRRNSCGHPNSLKLGGSTVTHHIEILLLNVFAEFS